MRKIGALSNLCLKKPFLCFAISTDGVGIKNRLMPTPRNDERIDSGSVKVVRHN